jgi:hypothetical protein
MDDLATGQLGSSCGQSFTEADARPNAVSAPTWIGAETRLIG